MGVKMLILQVGGLQAHYTESEPDNAHHGKERPMFIRNRDDVPTVEWGQGTSDRILTASDNMGFAVAHTVVRAGTEAALQYRNHLEACYCIKGSGAVYNEDKSTRHTITPGTIYVLNEHDAHYLTASEHEDMELISIFHPAITGEEKHTLTGNGFSSY